MDKKIRCDDGQDAVAKLFESKVVCYKNPGLMRTCLVLLLLTTVFVGCKKNKLPVTSAPYTKTTILYKAEAGVSPNLLSLDVYHFGLGTSQNVPVVLYVHGGAWRIGDKALQLQHKTTLFNALNYIFISINYRLSPNPSQLNNAGRIKFPLHNNDVADAIKWVYDNITTYGGNKNKMVIMGHSAGAHLVCLSGTSNNFLPARGLPLSAIKGVASIDTEGYDITDQMNSLGVVLKDSYENAFGTNPAEWQQASPIVQVTNGVQYPKFFIAKRGLSDRLASADAFIQKLVAAGVHVSQVNGSQYDHEGINDAIGAPGETAITEPLKLFLSQCFQ